MKNYLDELIAKTALKLPYLNEIKIAFDIPKIESHGDYSTNAAMLLTKTLKRNPRQIAEEIIGALEYDSNIITKVEIAGPGFINFFFSNAFNALIIKKILEEGSNYGKSNKYAGKTANVEFVSANPTGPLTVGHGRNAVIGDTVANLLEWQGYKVVREYYFNNAGRQMRMLGNSVKLRYLQLLGEPVEFPEDHYQGEYIKDIAQEMIDEYSSSLKEEDPEGKFKDKAEARILGEIKATLKRIDIEHETFFNENTLYTDKKIEGLLDTFKAKDLTYEQEGATWIKLSEIGGDKDKVMVKATGEPTYRLPDIAYHINKLERNYDLIIDIFGSDHIATYPDVLAVLKALNYNTERIKVLIYQFVTVLEDGEIVKMSTRKANYIEFDKLIDEAGKDAVRYFFNMRNMTSHMNFDIALAKKQTDENPVFYLQYAHARICSILKMTEKEGLKADLSDLSVFTTDEEAALLKKLEEFSSVVTLCAEFLEPHRLCTYLEELAAAFHKFYTFCRIIGSEQKVAEARISLIEAVKVVINNGLRILGVNAPERM